MRSYCIKCPNPVTDVFVRGKFGHRHKYTRRFQCYNGGRDWSDVHAAKEHQGLSATTICKVESRKILS